MKFLFSFIIIIIVGSLVYFFTQSKNTAKMDEPTTIEKLNNKQIEKPIIEIKDKNKAKNIDHDSAAKESDSEIDSTESSPMAAEILDKDNTDSMEETDDTPEYSEEVSGEDFKEFIGIALEELDSGDELAEAIITEMIKIAEAQPDHIEQVKSFYRACAEKPNLSNDNQQLCLKYLEKINETSN